MPTTLTGVLYDPYNAPAVDSAIRFTAESTSYEVLKGFVAEAETDSSGEYSLEVRFGTYTISVRQKEVDAWRIIVTGILVTEDVTADDLNELIVNGVGWDDYTPEVVQAVRTYSEAAVDAAAAAASASGSAASSSTSAADSASIAIARASAADASATSAAGSATSAAGSASAASVSATSAADSAAAAAQSASDAIIPAATETEIGGVEVATTAEALAGTAGKFPDAAGVRGAFEQYGLGATSGAAAAGGDANAATLSGFYVVDADSAASNAPDIAKWGSGKIVMITSRASNANQLLQVSAYVVGGDGGASGSLYWRKRWQGAYADWAAVRDSSNTVIDTNGFVKEASPVLRLHGDGTVTGNGHRDLADATAMRISEGVYEVYGTLGLASSGWTVQTPEDANGRRKVFVEYDEADGVIHVSTFVADYTNGAPVKGDPMDITAGRWIDIRTNETPAEEQEPPQ
ncbi:carboxypeptidase-like regulatory domain-containing protein [Cobetia sp. MC34]|uniref:phage tail fiber protein n=1 Tax=Cobetia sp. MC34 TaxID=2785080 RepID=UPI001BC91C50|nr:carboxypeptidase-like regulatory domain-containing protein [Cobetia sp. MC34]MBS4155251.1 prophage tail fiber N-terminal domain-containing protein [Cobetia sp. MC34]